MNSVPLRLLFNAQAAAAFLTALGADAAACHYRAIHWDKHLQPREDRAVHLPPAFESRGPRLEQLQQQGYRLYWLPNGGPHDKDVAFCIYLFVEWDDLPIDWQLQAWQELGLPEPTVMLNTGGKSIHCYWRLSQPIDPARWRAITARLIQYCKSDPSCKNPSRLMRLAGSTYIHKTDDKDAHGNSLGGTHGPAPAAVVRANPAAIYDAAIFEERLPELPTPAPALKPAPVPAPVGGGPSGAGGSREFRSFEELERMVADYPAIQADNDQYHEARDLACGLVRCMEAIGRSKADAIALISRCHPQATDTFAGVEKWDFSAYGIESFVAQCRSRGVDVRRHDLPKRAPIEILEPIPWDELKDAPEDEDAEALRQEVLELRRAGDLQITLADVLPRMLAEDLTTRAQAFPCDPLFFLLPMLCSTAGIIGRRLEVQTKRGFTQPLVLWGANVARPGSMKSPAAKVISGPLYRWQKQLIDKAKEELAAWNREKEREEDGHKDDPAYVAEWLADNPQPTIRRIVVGDATIERIGQYFGNGGTFGVVAFHDELSKWADNLQRGGKDSKSDSANWCEGYDSGTLDIGRVGRDDVFIPDCPISLFGSIQPEKMIAARDAAAKRNNGNPDGDGLLGRLVMVLPWRRAWRYNDLESDISDMLLNLLRDQIEAKVPPMKIGGDGSGIPTRVTFDPVALREVIIPHLHALSDEGERSGGERAQWLDKARGRVLRLAGLLHVLQQAAIELASVTDPISVETSRRAVLLSCWFLAQYDLAMAEFGAGPDALPPEVAKLLAKGTEWRKAYGAAPVPGVLIRKVWHLPCRGMKAAEVNSWLLATVGQDPAGALGWIEHLRQGVQWHPPQDVPPA